MKTRVVGVVMQQHWDLRDVVRDMIAIAFILRVLAYHPIRAKGIAMIVGASI